MIFFILLLICQACSTSPRSSASFNFSKKHANKFLEGNKLRFFSTRDQNH